MLLPELLHQQSQEPLLSVAPLLSTAPSAALTAIPVEDSTFVTINVMADAYPKEIELGLWNTDLEELILILVRINQKRNSL